MVGMLSVDYDGTFQLWYFNTVDRFGQITGNVKTVIGGVWTRQACLLKHVHLRRGEHPSSYSYHPCLTHPSSFRGEWWTSLT
jgi:hypothetical protein